MSRAYYWSAIKHQGLITVIARHTYVRSEKSNDGVPIARARGRTRYVGSLVIAGKKNPLVAVESGIGRGLFPNVSTEQRKREREYALSRLTLRLRKSIRLQINDKFDRKQRIIGAPNMSHRSHRSCLDWDRIETSAMAIDLGSSRTTKRWLIIR